jgi:tetratricopeptide (TPR) repeat protein
MSKKLLVLLAAVCGLLAGCGRKDVDPAQVSISSAAQLFDRSGDVEVQMNASTLRAIERGLSTPALGARVSFAEGTVRPALADDGCSGDAYSCLELILNNARAPYPELMKRWVEKLAAKSGPVSGGDSAEATRQGINGDNAAAGSEFQTAASHYSKALEQTPLNIDLSIKLVGAYLQAGEGRNATGAAERAVNANPRSRIAWQLLAAGHAVSKEPARAVDALLVAQLLASDQANAIAELRQLASSEATPLGAAAAEALALLAKTPPADSYGRVCHPTLPAVFKTCAGATISGVARYAFGDGVSSPARLADGATSYEIAGPTRLDARPGQLVRFVAAVGARPGAFTRGRFELLPFAGNAGDELAWDALQLVALCASANQEFAPSLFNTYETMETVKRVRIDAAHPSNGSAVLATARERVGYVYRCAIKDGKLVALQARELGGKAEWETMSALRSRRAEGARVAANAARAGGKARADGMPP